MKKRKKTSTLAKVRKAIGKNAPIVKKLEAKRAAAKQAKKEQSKPVTKALTKTQKASVNPYAAAFEEWKSGTPVKDLVAKLKSEGLQTSEFTTRKRFIELAGGEAKFSELRKTGAGGRHFGGNTGAPQRTPREIVTQSDTKVPRIEHMRTHKWDKKSSSMLALKDGWKVRRVYKGVTVSIEKVGPVSWRDLVVTIYVSPDGTEYVEAKSNERADLIRPTSLPGIAPDVRLRRFEDSSASKKLRRDEREVKRGQEAMAVKKQQRKQHEKKITKLAKRR